MKSTYSHNHLDLLRLSEPWQLRNGIKFEYSHYVTGFNHFLSEKLFGLIRVLSKLSKCGSYLVKLQARKKLMFNQTVFTMLSS